LRDDVFGDQGEQLHQNVAAAELIKRMRPHHLVVGLSEKHGVGARKRESLRAGMPPPLAVTTEARKAHNLTIIRNLEIYGIDATALGELLKRKLAANTTVGQWETKSGV
jgi:hypothetical protein